MRGDLLGHMGSPARHVEDDHGVVHRFEPCQRRGRSPGERRVLTGEEADLLLE
jgi:hypothetical protein